MAANEKRAAPPHAFFFCDLKRGLVMTASKLRAVATAFLLGTAMVCGASLVVSVPAQAAVRAAVGKPLQEAQQLAAKGDYKAAMAKVNEAEAVSNKTAEENKIVTQMKDYVAIKGGDTSTPVGAKAKFAADYNARKYKDVIDDAEALKKNNVLDSASMQIIAQAYYLSGDKQGCVKYIKSNFGGNPSDAALELEMRCAYDSQDEATQRQALETLVAHTGKTEYWNDLLKMSERAQGMRDHDTLDVYRLKLLTGTITGANEYMLLAQLAIQLGFPAEAQAVIEKAQAANLMKDERSNRLLALAKTNAAADQANMAKNLAAANAAPKGDPLVKIGEDQWGQGKAKEAVATIQAGMKKPLDDKNNAQIRLGVAEMSAGQKAEAVKTLDAVKGPDTDKSVMVAHLWSLYARH
jgi:hypothetical protein